MAATIFTPSIRVVSGLSSFASGTCEASEFVNTMTKILEGVDKKQLVAFVSYTDCVQGMSYAKLLGSLLGAERLGHLLEVRAFTEGCEFFATRDAMGKAFSWRFVQDGKGKVFDYLDEIQYLDIRGKDSESTNDSSEYVYHSINGGDYCLPIANARRIKIRNYLTYDEEGLASVLDYRVVRLLRKGE